MSRYKAVKPFFEEKEKKRRLAKKKARNYYIGCCIWGLLMLAGIIIGGLNQDDVRIVSWVCIAMGVITFLQIGFMVYAEKQGWSMYEVFWYDYIDVMPSVYSKEKRERERREQDLKEYRFKISFIMILLFGFSVGVIIAGVIRLIGMK